MSRFGSKDVAFMLVDGYSILGTMTQFSDTLTALTEDVTVLGEEWVEHEFVGVKQAAITQQGFFDDATDSSNDALSGSEGSARVLCYGLAGNTAGKAFTGYSGAMQATYERVATMKAFHKANASYQGAGVVEQGVIVHPLGAETADGDSEAASLDAGAGTTSGGAGYLQVTALTLGGYDDVTVTILDSDDDTTFVELIAFTDVDAAPTAERIEVAGAVSRYIAWSLEFNGTGSDPSATFMVGFVRH